jgi:hypothetical protein
MKSYAEVARDEELGEKPVIGAEREARLNLEPGQNFKVNFSDAEEPDSTVMVFRICGKVTRLSRCECIQLVFLLLTLVFVVTMLTGLLESVSVK